MIRRPPSSTRTDSLFPYTTLCRSHRGEFAAVVDFDVERDAVALVEARHAGALHRADVDESVGLSVVARDEAEALCRVEEFDGARGADRKSTRLNSSH